ncbi:MAG: hypothetical protein L3J47_00385 [Sulfurovum sp.]|nr:hypothetical protein [Sulfurovum sp.]
MSRVDSRLVGTFNVRSYGAVGDGVTDDTAAISAASFAAGNGGTVYLPSGTYLVSSTINYSARRFVGEHFWRESQGGTVLLASGSFTGTAVLSAANNSSSLQHIMINATGVDYGVHAFSSHGPTALHDNVTVYLAVLAGFFFEHCQVAHMKHLRAVSNLDVGFLVEDPNSSVISNCHAINNGGDGLKVVKNLNAGTYTVAQCQLEGNAGFGVNLQGVAAVNGSYLEHIRVRDCVLESNGDGAIRAQFILSGDFTGNRILLGGGVGVHPIQLLGSLNCTVRHNRAAYSSHADNLVIIDDNTSRANTFTENRRESAITPTLLTVTSQAAGSIKISDNLQDYSTVVPALGTWVAGDILYNKAPLSTGFIGWVCTVTGTPGTWAPFGDVGGAAATILTSSNVWAAAQSVAPSTLTYGANIATDASLSNVFDVTLTGATAQLDNPTNLADGQTLLWRVVQDGTGSRALTFGTNFDWGSDTAPDLTTEAAGALTVITGISDGTKVLVTAKLGYTGFLASSGPLGFDFSSPSGYETDYWDYQTQTIAGKFDNGVGVATLDVSGGLPNNVVPGVLNSEGNPYNSWKTTAISDSLITSDIPTGDFGGMTSV